MHLVPERPRDDRLMLARESCALMDRLADVDSVGEKLVERALKTACLKASDTFFLTNVPSSWSLRNYMQSVHTISDPVLNRINVLTFCRLDTSSRIHNAAPYN